jgi:hypothetical protein
LGIRRQTKAATAVSHSVVHSACGTDCGAGSRGSSCAGTKAGCLAACASALRPVGCPIEFHRIAKGAIRRGVKEKRFKSGEQWEVLRREEGAVIVAKDGVEKQLPLDQARKFSVFQREKITLSIGDRIRFTKNVKHRGQKFLNNELRTVLSIDEGKIIFDEIEYEGLKTTADLESGQISKGRSKGCAANSIR